MTRRSLGRPQAAAADELDLHRREIETSHSQGLTLEAIMADMQARYGVHASRQQYKRKFRAWGLRRYKTGRTTPPQGKAKNDSNDSIVVDRSADLHSLDLKHDNDQQESSAFSDPARAFSGHLPSVIRHDDQVDQTASASSSPQVLGLKATSDNYQPVEWHVNGNIGETKFSGLADTGANINAISYDEVKRLKQTIEHETTRDRILLPNGTSCLSRGTVNLQLRFDGESGFHNVCCSVVEKLRHGIVLGYDFLSTTRTLTTFFKKRIKEVACTHKHRQSICLLDGGRPSAQRARMTGFMYGVRTTVVPDTGSHIMAMSLKHARKLGLDIDTSGATEIKFANGTTTITEGVVLAPLEFLLPHSAATNPVLGIPDETSQEEASIDDFEESGAYGNDMEYEWHVIKGLPADVVLSIDFCRDNDVFSRFAHCFDQTPSQPMASPSGEIFGIYSKSKRELQRLGIYSKGKRKLKRLQDDYTADLQSDDPFSPEMMTKEDERRLQNQEEINSLPPAERARRQELESLRTGSWDLLLALYRAKEDWTAERDRWIAEYEARDAQGGNDRNSATGHSNTTKGKRRKFFHHVSR